MFLAEIKTTEFHIIVLVYIFRRINQELQWILPSLFIHKVNSRKHNSSVYLSYLIPTSLHVIWKLNNYTINIQIILINCISSNIFILQLLRLSSINKIQKWSDLLSLSYDSVVSPIILIWYSLDIKFENHLHRFSVDLK